MLGLLHISSSVGIGIILKALSLSAVTALRDFRKIPGCFWQKKGRKLPKITKISWYWSPVPTKYSKMAVVIGTYKVQKFSPVRESNPEHSVLRTDALPLSYRVTYFATLFSLFYTFNRRRSRSLRLKVVTVAKGEGWSCELHPRKLWESYGFCFGDPFCWSCELHPRKLWESYGFAFLRRSGFLS